MTSPRPFRLSFQTKVLVAVLVVLVPLPVLTVWTVSSSMEVQMVDEARQTLASAEDGFAKSLEIRSRNFLSHYQIEANEARMKVIADLHDQKTMEQLLRGKLNEASDDNEIILFTTEKGERLAAVTRSGTDLRSDDFEKAAADITRTALAGEPAS